MNVMNKLAVGTAMVGGMVAPVLAAIPAAVQTELDSAKTDGVAVAGILLAIGVAVWGALYLKRKFFG